MSATAAKNVQKLEPQPVNPMQVIQAAVEKGIAADELEKLLTLQERHEANQARRAFAQAMARFQADCPPVLKSGKADRYSYAPFDEVMKTIRPHLDAAGLSVRFSTETTGDSVITAICYVSHIDGHTEQSVFAAPVDDQMRVNKTQKMGSANSYAKRYALMNALNLAATNEDDDGEAAGAALLTDKQIVMLNDWLEDETLQIDKPGFFKYMGVESVDQIKAADWPKAEKAIDRKRESLK